MTGPLLSEVTAFGARYRVDLSRGEDAGYPVRFSRAEVSAFSLPEPRREPVTLGSFVGSVARGGSVNCEQLVLYPHGNGTHTECVGHVLQQPRAVLSLLPAGLVPALVVQVRPVALSSSGERYDGTHDGGDLVLTRKALSDAMGDVDVTGAALVVGSGLAAGDRSGTNPPYFTSEAMKLCDERGLAHLLTDLPSLDREDDGGALANHRLLWGLEPGAREARDDERARRTVTELCRLEHVAAGRYLLSLQVAPLESDAAPSRPVLHALLPL